MKQLIELSTYVFADGAYQPIAAARGTVADSDYIKGAIDPAASERGAGLEAGECRSAGAACNPGDAGSAGRAAARPR